jgi:outer membrane protein OmpA-like peptidoglycan-associated protein
MLGLRLGLTSGMISGDDAENDSAGYRERGFSFENRVTELSILAQFEPLGGRRFNGNKFNKILSPYLFAGVGVAFSNPDTDYNGNNSSKVQEDKNTDTQKSFLTTPFGIGLRYDISRKWNLGLEIGLRPTFDDLLDGVSASGNPNNNDWYTFGGLTLTTRFGSVDSDGDGVADESDKCPNIPGLTSTKGCPDADLDGIEDSRDACPEVAGDAKFNGCPDTDLDGVADNQDDCPNTPGIRRFRGCADTDGDGVPDPRDICPTIAGVIALDGCPDKDGDGITDADDACPELAGTKDANGCPDTDNDGIIDPNDKCPEVAGIAKYGGCPDSDGDGIGDGDDACPSNAGPSSNDGCPVIQEADLETLELAMKNVRFKTGSSELLLQSNAVLDEVAEVLNRYPNYDLKMSGYTDNVGNDATNQGLSQRRALACFQYLLVKNVSRDRISYAGYGETNPIADNNTPLGRATNRRVEFELILRK